MQKDFQAMAPSQLKRPKSQVRFGITVGRAHGPCLLRNWETDSENNSEYLFHFVSSLELFPIFSLHKRRLFLIEFHKKSSFCGLQSLRIFKGRLFSTKLESNYSFTHRARIPNSVAHPRIGPLLHKGCKWKREIIAAESNRMVRKACSLVKNKTTILPEYYLIHFMKLPEGIFCHRSKAAWSTTIESTDKNSSGKGDQISWNNARIGCAPHHCNYSQKTTVSVFSDIKTDFRIDSIFPTSGNNREYPQWSPPRSYSINIACPPLSFSYESE